MRTIAKPATPAKPATRDWPIPTALLALSAVPLAAGIVRLIGLSSGAPITPENARFFAAPLPVIIHIVGSLLFCAVGAFQFAPGFRRRQLGWHRLAGRVLAAAGLAAALSGLWMTQYYPLPAGLQGPLLYGFRLLIGAAMVGSIALAWAAIRRRDIARHRAWMIRGYAIGQGAGTQALIMLPWALLRGEASGLTRDLLMIAAWLINLAVAEWIIRRRASRGRLDDPRSSPIAKMARNTPANQ